MKNKLIKIIVMLLIMLVNSSTAYASLSYFQIIVAPININFHLEDTQGNISGYIPEGIANEIPNMGFYMKTGEPGESFDSHKIEQNGSDNPVSSGKYKLVLYGTTIGEQVRIGFDISYPNTTLGIHTALGEYLLPNVVWTYEFDIPATPPVNNTIELIKVSTPQDLISDINILTNLGNIGNQHFASELINEIQEIEKEKLKPAEKDDKLTPAQKAIKEYRELLNELKEKTLKPEKDEHLDIFAFDTLERDIDYIINHIQ